MASASAVAVPSRATWTLSLYTPGPSNSVQFLGSVTPSPDSFRVAPALCLHWLSPSHPLSGPTPTHVVFTRPISSWFSVLTLNITSSGKLSISPQNRSWRPSFIFPKHPVLTPSLDVSHVLSWSLYSSDPTSRQWALWGLGVAWGLS